MKARKVNEGFKHLKGPSEEEFKAVRDKAMINVEAYMSQDRNGSADSLAYYIVGNWEELTGSPEEHMYHKGEFPEIILELIDQYKIDYHEFVERFQAWSETEEGAWAAGRWGMNESYLSSDPDDEVSSPFFEKDERHAEAHVTRATEDFLEKFIRQEEKELLHNMNLELADENMEIDVDAPNEFGYSWIDANDAFLYFPIRRREFKAKPIEINNRKNMLPKAEY